MKAVVITEPGGPEKLAILDVPDPTPAPGELLVRVHATALNRGDLLQRRGHYPAPPGTSDAILGLEMAGEVLEVGTACSADWQEGDRVFALLPGCGYAEKVTVPAARALRIPDNLSFPEAAAIPEAFLTAYRNLFHLGELKAGMNVLVHAGGSGVGTAAIQLAKVGGATVATTAGSQEKLARCRELGADLTYNYKEGPFARGVLEATGGRGVDIILEFVGAPNWEQNQDVLATGGRLIVLGLMGGTNAALDLGKVLQKGWRIIGSTLRGQSPAYKARLTRDFWIFAAEHLRTGRLRPVVDRSFPMDEVATAHRYMEENRNFGKIVLEVG